MGLAEQIQTTLGTDVPTGIGERPANTGAKPFVVLWPDVGVRSAFTMQANDGSTTTIVAHCFGLTKASAEIAERKLAAAVYALHMTTVDGRRVLYPEQLVALPLSRDDDVNPPLYDLTVEWRLRTTPA